MPLLELAGVPGADHVVVRLSGEADLSTREQLHAGLRQAATLGSGAVLLDVAALRFCDCSALRELASFAAELARAGRSCRLTGASTTMRRLLRLAELTDLLDAPAEAPRDAP